MITDGDLKFSSYQDISAAKAGTPLPSTNAIDFSQNRDFGATDGLRLYATCPNLPASTDPNASIDVKVEVSPDNDSWTVLEEFPGVLLSGLNPDLPFLMRAKIPFAPKPYRYMRLAYTPSADLTAGCVTAGISNQVPGSHAYPRNYVA